MEPEFQAVLILDGSRYTETIYLAQESPETEHIGRHYFQGGFKTLECIIAKIDETGETENLPAFTLNPVMFKTGREGYAGRENVKSSNGILEARANVTSNEDGSVNVTVAVADHRPPEPTTKAPAWLKDPIAGRESRPQRNRKAKAPKGMLAADLF